MASTSQRWSSLNHWGRSGRSAASPGPPSSARGKYWCQAWPSPNCIPQPAETGGGLPGRGVDDAEGVLGRVARSHAAPEARLVARHGARPVQRRAALHRRQVVDGDVRFGVRGRDAERAEVRLPVGPQRGEGPCHLGGAPVAVDDRADRVRRVGDPEQVDEARLRPGSRRISWQSDPMLLPRADSLRRDLPLYDLGRLQAPVAADEGLAVAVVALWRAVRSEELPGSGTSSRPRWRNGPRRSGSSRCGRPSRGCAGRSWRQGSSARRS